ncbi:cuticular protein 11 [Halictus rubicundus]|uniref:cuticular protein 11 n=1 Tax=Halictus rubicundus TaxID=77578 RepID=UPI004035C839
MALVEKAIILALISITVVHGLSSYLEDEDQSGSVERTGHGGGHGDGGHGGGHGKSGHGGGHAYSYHHFSGPVSGHHQEVSWKDKHGHVNHDFVAHPKYHYAYGVDDKHTKDYHAQKEHRDGKKVEGEYHIHEPGGNTRSVKYHSDPHGGFFAEVHNYGGNDHSGGGHGGHKH